jgi:hypothetical protein
MCLGCTLAVGAGNLPTCIFALRSGFNSRMSTASLSQQCLVCWLCCAAVGAGNVEGGLDFANMLKPALARSQLQVIGATTLDEYRQHIETDPALSRRFQVGGGLTPQGVGWGVRGGGGGVQGAWGWQGQALFQRECTHLQQ